MKIYLFIKIADKNGSIEPFLYAFTNKKYLADQYEETRNMDMFIRKSDNIEPSEFMHFNDNHKGHLLTTTSFKTQPIDSLKKYDTVYMVVTGKEEETVIVDSDKIIYEMSRKTDQSASMFNDDILEALNTLGYFNIYKFYNNDQTYFYSGINDDYLNFDCLNWKSDELGVFLHFFGNTLKV